MLDFKGGCGIATIAVLHHSFVDHTHVCLHVVGHTRLCIIDTATAGVPSE